VWRADADTVRYRVLDTGRGVRVVARNTVVHGVRRVQWVSSVEDGKAVAQQWENQR
jgi:hypothetical protein